MKVLLLVALVAGYGYGAYRFWRGFHRTSFSQGRLYLTVLWPIFLIANRSYRQNFSKALKGQ
ncbi:MAG: hypothetical protein AAGF66_10660 [Cyanobacteria bacterium P01_H01_bin.119]